MLSLPSHRCCLPVLCAAACAVNCDRRAFSYRSGPHCLIPGAVLRPHCKLPVARRVQCARAIEPLRRWWCERDSLLLRFLPCASRGGRSRYRCGNQRSSLFLFPIVSFHLSRACLGETSVFRCNLTKQGCFPQISACQAPCCLPSWRGGCCCSLSVTKTSLRCSERRRGATFARRRHPRQ